MKKGAILYAGEGSESIMDGWRWTVGLLEYKVTVLFKSTCSATKLYKEPVNIIMFLFELFFQSPRLRRYKKREITVEQSWQIYREKGR